ncbi:type III-A CRISPR-associated RAMP protein Csm3 [Candidatus Poribacteria bacterium]|nr:type III-A CRISPR-associated RAMP protein Csm3 [Candidatus Poribacteria bacterium]
MANEEKKIKMRIKEHIQITGKIICLTGLTIGTGDVFGIGGIDKEMIRTGRDKLPYIPGSSLKGKMRHLFELMYNGGNNPIDKEGNPHSCDKVACPICRIFGAGKAEETKTEVASKRGPTRLIVRDALLDEDFPSKHGADLHTEQYTEIKAENVIDRLKGTATPRRFERVPAGFGFNLNLVYRQFEIKNEDESYSDEAADKEAEEDICHILKALSYVHRDYLGSSGSRGYGKVKFVLTGTSYSPAKNWIEKKIEKCPGVYWETA